MNQQIQTWLIEKGYEIIARKDFSDQRCTLIAAKIYKPGFVKLSTTESKSLRIGACIETAASLMTLDSSTQMRRMQMWKQIDHSTEKFMILFVPAGTPKIDYDHLFAYNQVIEYPIAPETILANEPRVSPLGILGWNP